MTTQPQAGTETAETWRCFHCDAVFHDVKSAAEHFGRSELEHAACQIKSHEGHLIHYIRKLEGELDSYRAEDSDIMRSIYTLEADHRQALIREEEKGYEKGITAQATAISELVEALNEQVQYCSCCQGSTIEFVYGGDGNRLDVPCSICAPARALIVEYKGAL